MSLMHWSQQKATFIIKNCVGGIGRFLFDYETPRVITIRNYRVGLIYRLVQLCIIAYLIGYVFIWTKSYQDFETAESSVTTKMKGLLHFNNGGKEQVWDSADFVIPPQENEAFFITTRVLYTENQLQGICPENADIGEEGIHCLYDSDCVEGQMTPNGNGLKTGRCVYWNTTIKTCQISTWCPIESDQNPQYPVLDGFESLTVLVKNHVAFPKFDVKRRNILASINQTYLERCRFHPKMQPLCPIFGIKDIVKFAGEDFDQITKLGGMISFNIIWNCNLDFDLELCLPSYSFRRLDDKEDKIAKGWNFRYASLHLDENGISRRNLVKVWGIRFVFHVNGRAGKFSPVNFAMNLGSGIGLLGIASLICEALLLSCVRPNTHLVQEKFVKISS